MKSAKDIMMEHCSDNGLLSLSLGMAILRAMDEYGKQCRSEAIHDVRSKFEKTPDFNVKDILDLLK